MDNLEVAGIFRDIASILELKGDNRFRIRAYERAAQNIEGLTRDLDEYLRRDSLLDIPGIGKDLSEKIKEFASSGRIKAYEELKKSLPQGLLEVLKIPSVGPKTAKLLFEKLKIRDVADLEKAIAQGRLKGIYGIKDKTIENIQNGIRILRRGRERMNLAQAEALAGEFIRALDKHAGIERISVAGSLRRRKETVRDIDILVISRTPSRVMEAFTRVPLVKEVISCGATKCSVRTAEDAQVDCRVLEKNAFGAALLYFTGSKNFNIKLRQLAIRRGLKINEYGVFRVATERLVCSQTEEEMLAVLGLPYIEPEMREDAGEIELGQSGRLPHLVQETDILGDLHVHSTWSDGGNTIGEIAEAARQRGYAYIAITDHSQGLKVARGLGRPELKKKRREIERLNAGLKKFRVLYATEADIDAEGNLDYKDEVLAEFDLVVAAIHSGFKQSKQQLTRRIVRACKNRHVHIIAHPTGRLHGTREPYEIDMEEVFRAARDTNTRMEVNSFPDRLDLDSHNCRRAKEAGVQLAINTDAHEVAQLGAMRYGVATARRGWLEKKDVLNALPLEDMLRAIDK